MGIARRVGGEKAYAGQDGKYFATVTARAGHVATCELPP
jgi:hypothetical protein